MEKKHPKYPGLNLTIRTLLGITKYFQKKDGNPNDPNKFLYNHDYDFLQEEVRSKHARVEKSIDAQIMDLADEIAYAAHDLEDALKSGLLTVQELIYEFSVSEKYKEAKDIFVGIANDARKLGLQAYRLETSEEYSFVMRKEITSSIVHHLMSDIEVIRPSDRSDTLGYKKLGKSSLGLKKLVFKAIS